MRDFSGLGGWVSLRQLCITVWLCEPADASPAGCGKLGWVVPAEPLLYAGSPFAVKPLLGKSKTRAISFLLEPVASQIRSEMGWLMIASLILVRTISTVCARLLEVSTTAPICTRLGSIKLYRVTR